MVSAIIEIIAKNPPSILFAGGILLSILGNFWGAVALFVLGTFLQILYLARW